MCNYVEVILVGPINELIQFQISKHLQLISFGWLDRSGIRSELDAPVRQSQRISIIRLSCGC